MTKPVDGFDAQDFSKVGVKSVVYNRLKTSGVEILQMLDENETVILYGVTIRSLKDAVRKENSVGKSGFNWMAGMHTLASTYRYGLKHVYVVDESVRVRDILGGVVDGSLTEVSLGVKPNDQVVSLGLAKVLIQRFPTLKGNSEAKVDKTLKALDWYQDKVGGFADFWQLRMLLSAREDEDDYEDEVDYKECEQEGELVEDDIDDIVEEVEEDAAEAEVILSASCTDLVVVKDGVVMADSLGVAERFGKNHRNVMEKVRQIIEEHQERGAPNFRLTSYKDVQGKVRPMFEMTRDGFSFLVMGFTGKKAAQWKELYIEAFLREEERLRAKVIEQREAIETLTYESDCKSLVPIYEMEFDDGLCQTSNARELYEFMGSRQGFSKWIKKRLEECLAVEGRDFITIVSVMQNGIMGNRGKKIDYHITLDIAKHIAMLERTERGRIVREYFIQAEKDLREKERQELVHNQNNMVADRFSFFQIAKHLEKQNAVFDKQAQAISDMSKVISDQNDMLKSAFKNQNKIIGAMLRRFPIVDQTSADMDTTTTPNPSGPKSEVRDPVEYHRQEMEYQPKKRYVTIKGFASLLDMGNKISQQVASKMGRFATKLCKEQNIEYRKLDDERYGEINSYPEEILKQVFVWEFGEKIAEKFDDKLKLFMLGLDLSEVDDIH